jgi:hypothetical protein
MHWLLDAAGFRGDLRPKAVAVRWQWGFFDVERRRGFIEGVGVVGTLSPLAEGSRDVRR